MYFSWCSQQPCKVGLLGSLLRMRKPRFGDMQAVACGQRSSERVQWLQLSCADFRCGGSPLTPCCPPVRVEGTKTTARMQCGLLRGLCPPVDFQGRTWGRISIPVYTVCAARSSGAVQCNGWRHRSNCRQTWVWIAVLLSSSQVAFLLCLSCLIVKTKGITFPYRVLCKPLRTY